MNKTASQHQKLWTKNEQHFMQSWFWCQARDNHKAFVFNDLAYVLRIEQTKLLKRRFGIIQRAGVQDTDYQNIKNDLFKYIVQNIAKIDWLIIEPNQTIPKSQFKDRSTSTHLETVVVNIDRPEDEIFADMSKSNRKYYRKCQREGVMIEKFSSGQEALERFSKVYEQIETTKKFIRIPAKMYSRAWQEFSEVKRAGIVILNENKQDIAAYMWLGDTQTAYQLYGGMTAAGRQRQASKLLGFESMLQAKQMGFKKYDMWGAAAFDESGFNPEDPLYGISVFKQSSGGQAVAYAANQYVVKQKLSYKIFKFERFLSKIVLKIRKSF